MTSNTKISNLISSQVPFFVRDDHPAFVNFVEAYYEWMEQSGETLDTMKNMRRYSDIDTSIDLFIEEFYKTYINLIPREVITDKTLILKHVKDFYRARGTEKSIRFLIRILFNMDVEFYYPKTDVLRASDGKWYIEKSIKIDTKSVKVNGVANSQPNVIENFENRQIKGNTSNALALVEKTIAYYESGTLLVELKISEQTKDFISGESIFTLFDEDRTQKSLTANLFSGIINSLTILDTGSLYDVGDEATVTSSNGRGGIVRVSKVSTGNISSLTVVTGGCGYVVNNAISFSGGGGTGATANVFHVDLSENIHPNTYNILSSIIAVEANTAIGNNGINESFAYQNLNTISVTTSNLRISTGASPATLINLSAIISTSNAYFETYDSLAVANVSYKVVSSSKITAAVTVNPAMPGGLVSVPFQVIKKANANTSLINALTGFNFANTGPIKESGDDGVLMLLRGSNYTSEPVISVAGNNTIKSMGILGRMEILDGGLNYKANDRITFTVSTGTPLSAIGTGAYANVTNVAANGAITKVNWLTVPGHQPGGSGYDQAYLPKTVIQTANGVGANVIVSACLTYGEQFHVLSGTIGNIEEMTIVSGGTGYIDPPYIDMTGIGDGKANVISTVVQGFFTYPGRYLNDDGHLSSYNFLQDRDYYQSFSYVVKLKNSIENYRKYLKDLIHPAGMKLFGEFLSIDDDPQTSSSRTIDANLTILLPASFTAIGNGITNISNVSVVSTANTVNIGSAYIEFSTATGNNMINLANGIYRSFTNTAGYQGFFFTTANSVNATGKVYYTSSA